MAALNLDITANNIFQKEDASQPTTAVGKLLLLPHTMPCSLLHKSLSDVDFTTLSNAIYFYCYSILGNFQPIARWP